MAVPLDPARDIFLRLGVIGNNLENITNGQTFNLHLGAEYRLGAVKSPNINGFGRVNVTARTHICELDKMTTALY
jgi:hypothetical protein